MFKYELCKVCVWYEESFGCPECEENGVCLNFMEDLNIEYEDTYTEELDGLNEECDYYNNL